MRSDVYDVIKTEMLKILNNAEGVSSEFLFGILYDQFVTTLGENVGWYLYQVKLDVEARGLIRSEVLRKGRNAKTVIKIVREDKPLRKYPRIKENTEKIPENNMQVVTSKFVELYSSDPMVIRSLGRNDLSLDKSDDNIGATKQGAINKRGAQIAMAHSEQNDSLIYSLKYDEFFSFNYAKIAKTTHPAWASYFLAIVCQLNTRGLKVGNFNCAFDGDLSVTSSSSPYADCGFVFALNELFDLRLSRTEAIHIAQWSEHNFVGLKFGILDQFAGMMEKRIMRWFWIVNGTGINSRCT